MCTAIPCRVPPCLLVPAKPVAGTRNRTGPATFFLRGFPFRFWVSFMYRWQGGNSRADKTYLTYIYANIECSLVMKTDPHENRTRMQNETKPETGPATKFPTRQTSTCNTSYMRMCIRNHLPIHSAMETMYIPHRTSHCIIH